MQAPTTASATLNHGISRRVESDATEPTPASANTCGPLQVVG